MNEVPGLTWTAVLSFGNLILSSAIVITAFALLGYMLTHKLRSAVARTFSLLLACVLVVSAADIVIPRVENSHAVLVWLRFQWFGIALVPAAYLHFSDAVLRTTHHYSRRRWFVVLAGYVSGVALLALALFTDLIVSDGVITPPITRLLPGPLFPLFVIYFVLTALFGGYNVYRARKRSLTPVSRRRMTYLTVSFAAPGLGVFPYLVGLGLVGLGVNDTHQAAYVLLLNIFANVAVGTMLVMMAYSVAFYGVLAPDRVVKHDLFHYLLRGPVVGTVVIVVMLVIPRVELILGLPRDTALIFAVVGVIVIGQLLVNVGKPWIDRLLFSQDRDEITWIQALERRLLTSSDLAQFLTNVLTGLCELLRVESGFVVVQTGEGLAVEAAVGSSEGDRAAALSPEVQAAWRQLAGNGQNGRHAGDDTAFQSAGAFWYAPLDSQDGGQLLGMLVVTARTPEVSLNAEEQTDVTILLSQAAAAISDRYVQEGVFATLQRILPDIERIQEWRSALSFAPPPVPGAASADLSAADTSEPGANWQQWVKDALSHYWGGPKLTNSPLLNLNIMRRAIQAQDGNASRALRAVLLDAIERQRPAGDRKLTASEWLLYNILDMRFVQGQRVRDIASRLAISESDLYRKQRVAVAEVARTLAEMEQEVETEANQPEAVGQQGESALRKARNQTVD